MKTKEVEKVLNKISNKEPLDINEKDLKVIQEMIEEGLIKPSNESYSLTDYGKVIEVMGYETHQKQEPEPLKTEPFSAESIIIFLACLIAIFSIVGCVFYLCS